MTQQVFEMCLNVMKLSPHNVTNLKVEFFTNLVPFKLFFSLDWRDISIFGHKVGEFHPISIPMSHFRLKPEIVGKLWLIPQSNRIEKLEVEK